MQTAIKVEQLSNTYDNLLAVDKINLSVKCGTVYGLLGANGAGKSSILRNGRTGKRSEQVRKI